jgi:hypothetical protein
MRRTTALLALAITACAGAPADAPAPAPTPVVEEAAAGLPARGPGERYNACERIWCSSHARNFDLDHFAQGHVGWVLHDDAHGDVFVPRHRTSGPAFPRARDNVVRMCGQHLHPYWLSGRPKGPVTRSGYNVALGYPRSHFATYGTRIPPCCLNEEGWGFLHASAPRQYRFGDLTTAGEMAGSGWQKALPARLYAPR